ncbi:MAG TPA: hypothetical protein VGZ69_04385 [Candidatus Rhabdochlamydia sp.]|jgi:hypothetical protein|nr:hypothetical protein [Candidatus Rhabdochlamydia sp.]
MWKLSRARKGNRETVNSLVLWGNLGLVFFLAALSCLLFKYTQIFCCLFFVSAFGFMMTFYWGTKGFSCSVCFITTILISLKLSNRVDLWNVLFAISIVLSWLLLLLGRQEISFYFKNKTLKEQDLEGKCTLLQKKIDQLQELLIFKSNLQKKQQEAVFFKKQLEELKVKLLREEKEKGIWQKRYYTLIQEISGHQNREKKLQSALKNTFHMQAESTKNFQEKTHLLNQTRKRVFHLDNALLALERDYMEKEFDPQVSDFMSHIMQMQEIQSHLEDEISLLEEIICSVCNQKKKTGLPKRTAKKAISKFLQNISSNQKLSKSRSPLL